jgi:hypothetical protein
MRIIMLFLGAAIVLASCQASKKRKVLEHFHYEAFKDSMNIENYDASPDTANVFDTEEFAPAEDSITPILIRIDTLWHLESTLMEKQDLVKKLSRTKEKYTIEDKEVILENIKVLDSFLVNRNNIRPVTCREKECLLYAEIVKPVQKLYLYIEGELKDSFKVSTGRRIGKKNYETASFSVSPSGPMFTKYTSRKFPGGNWEGLGNMPYAVFVKGGYAIHGTTPGNFRYLGTRASHGCIRLHPYNAKLFYELVKRIGLENTWVRVTDSLTTNAPGK